MCVISNNKNKVMKNISFLLLLFSVLFSCTELDNYDEPDARLNGEVIDKVTGEPLSTEQPQGFRIRYREVSEKYPDAQNYYFWGKADGSFNNSKMFAATYEVTPVEGPFMTPTPEIVTVEGTTTVRFEVTPYLSISADRIDFNASAKSLHVEFNVSRPQGSDANPTFVFVALTWNPNVSYNAVGTTGSGLLTRKNITTDDLDKTLSFDIDLSSLTPNHIWYVRMGCGSNKNSSRFNYSKTHTFEY